MPSHFSVYRFLDYRSFLKAVFDETRHRTKKSARKLFHDAGFKSLGHFYLLTAGKTHLSESRLEFVAKAWGVPEDQWPYLLRLREFCVTKSLTQKKMILAELEDLRNSLKVKLLSKSDIEQLGAWYAIPLLEALATRFASTAPQRMADLLGISNDEINGLLKLFERLGLALPTSQGYRRIEGTFEAYLKESSDSLKRLHSHFIQKALESVHGVKENERALMILTLPIEKNQINAIRREAEGLFQKLNRRYDAGLKSNAVYQINLQVFPVIDFER